MPYLAAAPHDLDLTTLIDWARQPGERPMPALRGQHRPGS
jgi:hypothetical protein